MTSKYEYYVVTFLATSYLVLLGQDILSELGLITYCGNGIVRALISKRICASESTVVPARDGIHMKIFVPGIENGDIICFLRLIYLPINHYQSVRQKVMCKKIK